MACAVGLTVGAVFVHLGADQSFDDSADALTASVDASADAWLSLDATASALSASVASAEQIVEAAAKPLAGQKHRTALREAAAAASDSVTTAGVLVDGGVDDGEIVKPFWTWELWQGAAALDERAADADVLAAEFAEAEAGLDDSDTALDEAAVSLYASVAKAAKGLEKQNVSARTGVVLDFRDAAQAVTEQEKAGSAAAVAFSAYVSRAKLLRESNASELAEKAGPLSPTRLDIEAFARSISGGVVLDFDWKPVVNGMGHDWGMGGQATWDAARGGFSTITLSNSVAEQWPSADARALVAHEVGHAISSKCYGKFDWESKDANEEWATAWAISMGHTATGNGVWAYGYPSQRMIDKAATCR